MRGSSITRAVTRITLRGIMVVVVELPKLFRVDLSSTAKARDDLPALEPADELASTAQMGRAVALAIFLVASPPQPLPSTWLNRQRLLSTPVICSHSRISSLTRGDTRKRAGVRSSVNLKNRIPKPFPPTFPRSGFAAPCSCDEAERQDHGQAPRNGHLLSERRRMGLDLFVVRTTRSREGVLEQGQRPPSRAYRTRESGPEVGVDVRAPFDQFVHPHPRRRPPVCPASPP